jgi:signal transduction histidine kinase
LERRSLAEALEKLVKQYAKEWKLKARFEAVGGDRPLPIRIEAALYRMAQEALTNVARHAEADHLIVRYVATPVDLRIEDDGKGFDPDTIAKDRFGLVGMNERTRLLGGNLDICSEPGGGTRLDIHIPVEMPS